MRFLLAISLFGAYSAQGVTQTGQINGAQFRIDLREKWNGAGLIIYCHGYSPVARTFENPGPNELVKFFDAQGFAVAQSGYAAGGWAIQEAVENTQELLRYFVRKYGAPKETYVTGHSMGGFLTMALLETHPDEFDGGLALCGPLAPASWFMARRMFDLRVVFDYYFPGALPSPVKVPADFGLGEALNHKIEAMLDGKPKEAEAVLRSSGIHTNKEFAGTIVFFTYILRDLQLRGGGDPSDNRSTLPGHAGR
jgi:pimeloyl-ACP methyl ester carboxylesterase